MITKQHLLIPEDDIVIGYTGSTGGRKGIHFLINAFEKQQQKTPNITLLLVGIDQERLTSVYSSSMKKDIEQTTLRKIKCVGFQHKPEDYMALFDMFAFPGTRDEGLTGALREASAMAIPIISTDVGGNRELVNKGKCGILIPHSSVTALQNAMATLILEPELRKNMGANGRLFVSQFMSIDARVSQVLNIYAQVLNKRIEHDKPKKTKNLVQETNS